MAIKFLYIDDEPSNANGIIRPVANEELSFEIDGPKTWNEQKTLLIDNKGLNKYDGLLLDLKLEFSSGDNNDIKFSGADLAQTIRTDVKAGKIDDLPIFLCSTDANYMALFDKTSYDLFDRKYKKDLDFNNGNARPEFIAFAQAYTSIENNRDIQHLLQKAIEENDDMVALNAELAKCQTPHEMVHLINHAVIQSSGILLDEALLAIRLGVDIEQSDDWQELKESVLNKFRYQGILSECYERWWQADILNWWKETMGKSLIVMSAQERVNTIIQKLGIMNISAITLPEHHRFDTFWYKCRLSENPLEPSDALRTTEMPRYVWQEPSYISMAYVMSDERDRQATMALLGANEQKIVEDLTTNADS